MLRYSGWLLCAGLLVALLGCQKVKPVSASLYPTAPPNPWESVDNYALAAPQEVANNPELLANYLSKAGDHLAVARAIYRWIAANISYDVTGMRSGEYGDLSPSAVLKRKAAVCGGFGSLFEELARRAGLEVATIYGHAKGTGYHVGDPLEGIPSHAWNAFKADGRWRLVDCTWGAGALEESGLYEARFEPFYFDTPPEFFAYTHLPSEERWQLMDPPWSGEEFLARPWLKPAFFHAGLRPGSAELSHTGAVVTLVLKAKATGQLRAYLIRDGEKVYESPLMAVVSEDEIAFNASLPVPGVYAIRLFAQHSRSPASLEWAGDFPVQSK